MSAFGVFLAIGGLGFLFLLISLIFGEIFDHLGGGFDHDIGDHGGPGFFNVRGLTAFVTAFGCTGAIATHFGLSALPASLVGSASGVFFAAIVFLFARFLHGQQASTDLHSTDVVGQPARVIIGIPAGGMGQVRCKIGEELIDRIARSKDGQAIAENTVVRIEEVLGETVIVRRE